MTNAAIAALLLELTVRISAGQVNSVTGTLHQITASPTTGAVTLSLPSGYLQFPSRVLTTTASGAAPLNIGSLSAVPSPIAAGDIYNLSNVLYFNNATSSVPLVTTDGTTFAATQIPSVSAAGSDELVTLGATLTGSGDIGVVSATGTGNGTFVSLIASGTATGSLQLFSGSNSLTLKPASTFSSNVTLNFPLGVSTDTVATLAGTQTLTGKTLTAPVVNTATINSAAIASSTITTSAITVADSSLTIYLNGSPTITDMLSAANLTAARTLKLPDSSGVLISGGTNPVTLASPTVFDTTVGTVQRLTLTSSVSSSTINSAANGQRVVIYIIDGGAFTFAFPTNMKGAMTVLGNKTNVQAFFYDQTSSSWIAESPGVSF